MLKYKTLPFKLEMQESEYFGETLFGHVFSGVGKEGKEKGEGSDTWLVNFCGGCF